jgi:flavin-dependent dehydrogenase
VAVFEKNPEIGSKICAGGLTSKAFGGGIPISLAERYFILLRLIIWVKL